MFNFEIAVLQGRKPGWGQYRGDGILNEEEKVRIFSIVEAARQLLAGIRPCSEGATETAGLIAQHPSKRSPLEVAVDLYTQRRKRGKYFPSEEIFGEPAWDILLDLYINETRGVTVTVKGATIGSGVPGATAHRWLKVLEEKRLIRSEPDLTDHRKRNLKLSDEGYAAISGFLQDIS